MSYKKNFHPNYPPSLCHFFDDGVWKFFCQPPVQLNKVTFQRKILFRCMPLNIFEVSSGLLFDDYLFEEDAQHFHQVCKNFNVELLEVAITDLKEGIYYANLVCKKGDHIIDIDSRSSDALALALRFDCPIYIDELLLNKVCIEDKRDEQQTIQEFEEELEEELKEIENMTIDELDKDQTNFTKKTLTELKSMLKKALQNEDYELAAKLRDEISKRK